jgi:cell division protein FtsW
MVIRGSISFVLVLFFSASSNLAYLGHGTGNTLGYLVKTFGAYLYGSDNLPAYIGELGL